MSIEVTVDDRQTIRQVMTRKGLGYDVNRCLRTKKGHKDYNHLSWHEHHRSTMAETPRELRAASLVRCRFDTQCIDSRTSLVCSPFSDWKT